MFAYQPVDPDCVIIILFFGHSVLIDPVHHPSRGNALNSKTTKWIKTLANNFKDLCASTLRSYSPKVIM